MRAETCRAFARELEAIRASGLDRSRPNTMNRDGVVLSRVERYGQLSDRIIRILEPIKTSHSSLKIEQKLSESIRNSEILRSSDHFLEYPAKSGENLT